MCLKSFAWSRNFLGSINRLTSKHENIRTLVTTYRIRSCPCKLLRARTSSTMFGLNERCAENARIRPVSTIYFIFQVIDFERHACKWLDENLRIYLHIFDIAMKVSQQLEMYRKVWKISMIYDYCSSLNFLSLSKSELPKEFRYWGLTSPNRL